MIKNVLKSKILFPNTFIKSMNMINKNIPFYSFSNSKKIQ